MGNSSYTISPRAIEDLNNILDYMDESDIDNPYIFIDLIFEKLQSAISFPQMYEKRIYGNNIFRVIHIKGYSIFYRLEHTTIVVTRILHTSQDTSALE